MAEDQFQEKTEQPTPKRREDARKKGDVPRSRELTMTGVMLSGAAAMLLLSGPFANRLLESFAGGFQLSRSQVFDTSYMVQAFVTVGKPVLIGMIPLGIVLLSAVFLSAASIGGWAFSMQAVGFKLERLSPVSAAGGLGGWIDFLTGSVFLPLGGLLIAVFAGRVAPRDIMREELRNSGDGLFRFWRVFIR